MIIIKVQIYHDITLDKLKKVIPPQYVSLLTIKHLSDQLFSTIIFLKNNKEVVLSSDAKKGIKKLGTTENMIIVLGINFTVECRELFKENNIEFIRLKDFSWTDERYIEIHAGY